MADEEQKDLRTMLAEAHDTETAAPATDGAAAPAEKPVVESAEKPAEDQSGARERRPDGRFAPKEAVEEVEEKPETEVAGVKDATIPDKPADTPTTTAAEAPSHWSQADKEWVAKLPSEHRGEVIERFKQIEAGFTPKLQRLAQFEKEYSGAVEAFAPHIEAIRQRGQTPSDVIKIWANVEEGLLATRAAAQAGRSDPRGAQIAARLIQNYAIDPAEVARYLQGAIDQGQAGATNGNGAAPPYVADPVLAQKVDGIEKFITQQQQIDQARRDQAAKSTIETFANEKNADGSPKHPFFSELESDITALAQFETSQGRPLDLSTLYNRAVWLNDSTRERQLSSQRQADEKRAADERKAKAEAAKKAAVSVAGAPSPGQAAQGKPTTRSLRDDLLAAETETMGR